jgi:hypothetical protein
MYYTAECFPACPTGTAVRASDTVCVPDSSLNVDATLEAMSSSFPSCHHPTYHSERGAYFDGESFLEFDSFGATSSYYINVWVRPRASGFVFHHNFATRPYNFDRDLCDDFDDFHMQFTKEADYGFWFDECKYNDYMTNNDGTNRANWFGWHMISMNVNSFNAYENSIFVDGVKEFGGFFDFQFESPA